MACWSVRPSACRRCCATHRTVIRCPAMASAWPTRSASASWAWTTTAATASRRLSSTGCSRASARPTPSWPPTRLRLPASPACARRPRRCWPPSRPARSRPTCRPTRRLTWSASAKACWPRCAGSGSACPMASMSGAPSSTRPVRLPHRAARPRCSAYLAMCSGRIRRPMSVPRAAAPAVASPRPSTAGWPPRPLNSCPS
mmetsp:Transcript_8987/g.17206  ORF Transcript_8987/g.17206 Transcript_8987/m.17206 type:complete len:200 (+) Transcript_8987:163-762(+)